MPRDPEPGDGAPHWHLFSKPVSRQDLPQAHSGPVRIAKSAAGGASAEGLAMSITAGGVTLSGSRAAIGELLAELAQPGGVGGTVTG
jgi:hypothetical protein